MGTSICGKCGKAYTRTYYNVCPYCKSALREVWNAETKQVEIWNPVTNETKPKLSKDTLHPKPLP